MKKNILYFLTVILLMGLCFAQFLWAGQIVSENDREWAKTILSQEKSLKPVLKKNTVAVFYFNNLTQNREIDPFQKGIAIMLMTDLAKIKKLTIVERTKIQALLDEIGLGKSGLFESGTISKNSKLLGARFIIGGNFLKGEKTELKIASDILNVKKAKTPDNIFSEGKYKELLTLEKELAFKIIKELNIKLTRKEVIELNKPMSTNMQALSYLFTGVDLSDKGKYQTAKRYYQKAIELDPELKVAKHAVSELTGLRLIPQPPKSKKILNTTRKRTSTTNDLGFDQRYNRSVSGEVSETTDITVKW